MNKALGVLGPIALLLGLSGCNNVVSNEPWFTAADTQGVPPLRDGLWVMITEDHCRVKLEKPAERWPDCADAFYVRGHEWLGMNWDDSNRHKRVFESWESLPLLLAAGDPVILQLDEGSEPPASEPEFAISDDDDEPHWRYSYAGMRPTEFDSHGAVVAFEFWGVQCGPWHYELKGGVEYTIDELSEGYVTEQPFPGLTVVGQKCTAESVDALRRAAIFSRDMSEPRPVRWVRDGWH